MLLRFLLNPVLLRFLSRHELLAELVKLLLILVLFDILGQSCLDGFRLNFSSAAQNKVVGLLLEIVHFVVRLLLFSLFLSFECAFSLARELDFLGCHGHAAIFLQQLVKTLIFDIHGSPLLQQVGVDAREDDLVRRRLDKLGLKHIRLRNL